jgi:hypothetical protein
MQAPDALLSWSAWCFVFGGTIGLEQIFDICDLCWLNILELNLSAGLLLRLLFESYPHVAIKSIIIILLHYDF